MLLKITIGLRSFAGCFLFFCLVLHKNEIRIQDDTLNSISLADMSSSLAAYHIYRREKKMFG